MLGALFVASASLWLLYIPAAPQAGACDCGMPSDEHAFEFADVVFVGSLIDRIEPEVVTRSTDLVTYVFEVDVAHKGKVTEIQEVVSVIDSAACGIELEPPGSFLVFGRFDGDGLSIEQCGGTRQLPGGADTTPFLAETPLTPTTQHSSTTATTDPAPIAQPESPREERSAAPSRTSCTEDAVNCDDQGGAGDSSLVVGVTAAGGAAVFLAVALIARHFLPRRARHT